jgi:hypothetical protein
MCDKLDPAEQKSRTELLFNAWTTLLKVDKLLLIDMDSVIRSLTLFGPTILFSADTFDLLLSEPARSTNSILPKM